jgi:hypothetical protein
LFVIDFLIRDVAIRQAGYPGSIAEKEAFSVELLDCILTFASRDASGKGVVLKNGAVFDRRRRDSENAAAKNIIEALLGQEVIAALISLLFSMWDGTRSTSFRFLSRAVLIGRMHEVELPTTFTSQSNFQGMEARAVHLASSPRQREADTGARILAFLYLSLSKESKRSAYMEKIVDLLERRLSTMKSMLARLLSGKADSDTGGGTKLPLSHGLTHSLCLMVEHADAKQMDSVEQYEQMTSVLCQALQISLTVVADVKEGSLIDGMDEDLVANTDLKSDRTKSGTPLNVNTGAIGANGTFSSVKAADTDQHTERLAIQRVVVSPSN